MPGLAGFSTRNMGMGEGHQVALRMRDLMTRHDGYIQDSVFCDEHVCTTRCHTNVLQQEAQPFTRDGISVWMDGEFYNRSEIVSQRGGDAATDPQLLHALYQECPDLSLLKQVDGVFAAVIYDPGRHVVHLVTDRYGFRHLYWTVCRGRLAWASEVKALLGLPGFEAKIDRRALGHFIGIGHFIHDRTWFEDVRTLSPASALTWDLREGRQQVRRYWWWDEDVKPLSGKIDKDQLAEEMGRRFIDGVRRRTRERGRVGIELSGGLDSRAAFAAMPEGDYPIHAVTLGKKGCEEVRIAAAVTRVKHNAIHHVFELTGDNWLMSRVAGVWQTDGCLNLRHMHDFFLRGMVKQYYDVYLHGAGGGIVGGASQFEPTQEAFFASLRRKYHKAPELLTPEFVQANQQDLADYFNSLGSSHALYANRIIRSFTIHSAKANRDAGVECRFPIFDNSFQELLFSIPLEQRLERGLDRDDTLYKKMLLRAFPAYYRTIPYQNIGIPISWPDPANLVSGTMRFVRRAKNKVLKEALGLVGATFSYPNWYTDYENWLRREPARSFFDKLLTSPSALYGEYVPRPQVGELWSRHLKGEDHAEMLCRYLTLELWLQQVYEGRYRRLGSEEADVRSMQINHSMKGSLA